ncbi:MAG: hypothetical protein WAT19_14295 [Ferruginibacter sp.]
MKLMKSLVVLTAALVLMLSCEKENSYEGGATGNSEGSLKFDGGNKCLPSNVNGVYKTGTALASTNYVDVQVNVTTAGAYVITTDTVNGMYFRAVGIFGTTGNQMVRLSGAGTPSVTGINNLEVKYLTSTCIIGVQVIAANTRAAKFTLSGSPAGCSGYTVNGTYKAGTALTASNTLTFNVIVDSIGTYSLSVPTTNGMIFTGTGYFASTGPQTVTLSGFGVPSAAGVFNTRVSPTDTTKKCTFALTVLPTGGTTNAVYTMGGTPNNCTTFSSAGTYNAGTAMTGSNTVNMDVAITTAGTYTISTNTVNGVTFRATGSFSAIGTRTVQLTAIGTPTAAGTFNYTVTGGSSSCSFPITFGAGGGGGSDYIRCKIDGVNATFNFSAVARINTAAGTDTLSIEGDSTGAGISAFGFNIERPASASSWANTYSVNQFASNIHVDAGYGNLPALVVYVAETTGATQTNPFTITITSATATRLTGTFSGKLEDFFGFGPDKLVTAGEFSVPIQ